jgi:hypothetical protein
MLNVLHHSLKFLHPLLRWVQVREGRQSTYLPLPPSPTDTPTSPTPTATALPPGTTFRQLPLDAFRVGLPCDHAGPLPPEPIGPPPDQVLVMVQINPSGLSPEKAYAELASLEAKIREEGKPGPTVLLVQVCCCVVCASHIAAVLHVLLPIRWCIALAMHDPTLL